MAAREPISPMPRRSGSGRNNLGLASQLSSSGGGEPSRTAELSCAEQSDHAAAERRRLSGGGRSTKIARKNMAETVRSLFDYREPRNSMESDEEGIKPAPPLRGWETQYVMTHTQ